MVAYSFNPRFFDPIRQGVKTQTIRANGRRRHARPGELLQLYTGMRTQHCRRILPDVPCLMVMAIEIDFLGAEIARIKADGIPCIDLDAFAIRDGFVDLDDMSAFWRDNHPDCLRAGFFGVVIEWARPAETQMAVAA